MSVLEFGEGTTPKEIHDPERYPQPSQQAQRGAPWKYWVAGAVLLTLMFWMNPFVGGVSRHERSGDIFTSRFGVSYGSTKVFGRAGQTLLIDYDVKVKTGSLAIRVHASPIVPKLGLPTLRKLEIDHTQKSSASIRLPETGFYSIEVHTWRSHGVYDVDYDVSWRVR